MVLFQRRRVPNLSINPDAGDKAARAGYVKRYAAKG